MVAQSCENVVHQQWGRTSPLAGSIPVNQEPMDLVKRKHDWVVLGDGINIDSSRQNAYCQLDTSQSQIPETTQASLSSSLKQQPFAGTKQVEGETSKLAVRKLFLQRAQSELKLQALAAAAAAAERSVKDLESDASEKQKDCDIQLQQQNVVVFHQNLEQHVKEEATSEPRKRRPMVAIQGHPEENQNTYSWIIPNQAFQFSDEVLEQGGKSDEQTTDVSRRCPDIPNQDSDIIYQNIPLPINELAASSQLFEPFPSDNNGEALIIVEAEAINGTDDENTQSDDVLLQSQDKVEDSTADKEDKVKQNNNTKRSRSESQKKMEEGKAWLLNNLMLVASSLSVVKLNDVEKYYLDYCQTIGKEPLATPVLARLIHSLFPGAEKCRLGARGHQRIHYRSLELKRINAASQQPPQQAEGTFIKDGCCDQNSKLDGEEDQEQSKTDNPEGGVSKEVTSQVNDQCTQMTKSQPQKTSNKPPLLSHADKFQVFSKVLNANGQEFEEGKPISQGDLKQELSGQDDEEGCKAAAKKFSEVLKWITGQGESHKKSLLRDFAHSASCQKPICEPVCLMFRRVRRHVVGAQHSCSILRLYSMLLRHHVSSCTQKNCGLPACPALRATRPGKRSLDQQLEPVKRAAISSLGMSRQVLYQPSSLVLAPRSPGGSLPGSPVNSPPSSPDALSSDRTLLSLPAGSIQYVMVPVVMPMSENRGS